MFNKHDGSKLRTFYVYNLNFISILIINPGNSIHLTVHLHLRFIKCELFAK